ncbi:MAG: hypothetical protein WC325_08730 [Candidatus Bathyarchaeia archaeon]
MAQKKLVALGLICVILTVGLLGTVLAFNQTQTELQTKTTQISELKNNKNSLESQVSSLQAQELSLNNTIGALESQVSTLENETTVLGNEKTALETQVSTLESENSGLQTQVSGLESETSTLSNQVGVLESQVSSLQTQVTTLQAEAAQSYSSGYVDGESDGYAAGYDVGYSQGVNDTVSTGYYLRDPTYQEALSFIAADLTDLHPYTQSYVCYDFTADFNANAEQQGYRCGFVYIEFTTSAHAIACFNTTDHGLIYVEPQNDEIVTLAIGQTYLGYYILHIGIIW